MPLVIVIFRLDEIGTGVLSNWVSQSVIPEFHKRCSVTVPIPGMWRKVFFNIVDCGLFPVEGQLIDNRIYYELSGYL